MSLRPLVWVGLACLLIGIAPILSVIVASLIAEWAGCTLHEGFVNPCAINGTDIGDTLYFMFVTGWFMLLSWPLALGGAVLLLVLVVIALLQRFSGPRSGNRE